MRNTSRLGAHFKVKVWNAKAISASAPGGETDRSILTQGQHQEMGGAGPGSYLGCGGAAVVLLSPDLSLLLLEVQFLYYNQREDHQAVRAGRGAREEALGGSLPGLH